MLVKDIMTKDFVKVPKGANLHRAVGTMLRKEVSNVVVVDGDGTPSTFLTGRQALEAVFKAGRPMEEIPLSAFETGMNPTLSADRPIIFAIGDFMNAGQDAMPVIRNMRVVGVLDNGDILSNVDNMRKEVLANS